NIDPSPNIVSSLNNAFISSGINSDDCIRFSTFGVSIFTGGFPYSDVIHSEVRNSVVGLPKNLFFIVEIPLVATQYAKPMTITIPVANEILRSEERRVGKECI